MSAFTVISLDRLPVPQVIEPLDFERIFEAMLVDLRARDPVFSALVESDPAYKILEVCAYRELLLRQRVNDAAKAVMLAYATGGDLDHLGALFGVLRQVVTPANPSAYPPVAAVMESDSRFRYRIQISLEGHTTAGSVGSYTFWGLSASADVKDIDVFSPSPGVVEISVLSRLGDGTPDEDLVVLVEAALNAEHIRPLTDQVVMVAPEIVHYDLEANLFVYAGPDPATVRAAALEKVTQYVTENHLLGHDITLSGLYAALHQPGVQRVELVSPTETILIPHASAAFCDSITVNSSGIDE